MEGVCSRRGHMGCSCTECSRQGVVKGPVCPAHDDLPQTQSLCPPASGKTCLKEKQTILFNLNISNISVLNFQGIKTIQLKHNYKLSEFKQPSKRYPANTKHLYNTNIHCWANVVDVVPKLYECYAMCCVC